jgi:hypothetical protein
MKIESVIYRSGIGWSGPLPTVLDSASTLVLVFGSTDCQDSDLALEQLRQAFPRSLISGCSTSGEINADQLLDATLTVAVIRFERASLTQASTPLPHPDDSGAAGRRLAEAIEPAGLRAVLLLSDGLGVNGSQLVEGLNAGLKPGVRVMGGLAGDSDRFKQTWVIDHGVRASQRVCAICFYGEAFHLVMGSGGGWSDFGPERRITRAHGQVLYELDGKPALALYKSYLGELASGLPGTALRFPLQVKAPQPGAEPLVRTVLGIDEAQQSMTFAGDIPQGGTARLMRATQARLVDAAGQAATDAAGKAAAQGSKGTPALVLSVSCVGRRMILGQHTEDELELVAEAFSSGCIHVGFYSYGEIAPAGSEVSRLHNQTIAVGVFTEDMS